MKSLIQLAVVVVLLGVPSSLHAALQITLTPAVQNSAQSQTLLFTVSLTNNSGTDSLYLNDIQFSLSGNSATHLTPDSNTYFSNVPGILLPNETYSGPLFSIALDGTATPADYGGTVNVLGGADIFASGNLASANFAVLFPSVTLVATDASASEYGPDNGVFTVTRTGRTDTDLTVTFSTTGSAVNGTTYSLIPTSITIPSGSASQTITLTPLPDAIAQGDRNAVFTITTSDVSPYALGASLSDTVVVHDKPAEAWRVQTFGGAANDPKAADLASWKSDGLLNLLAYALNIDPTSNDRSGLPISSTSAGYLTLSYVPNSNAPDLTYAVEASTDLIHWNTNDVEAVNNPNPNPPNQVTFRYKYPVNSSAPAFLHLRVTRN